MADPSIGGTPQCRLKTEQSYVATVARNSPIRPKTNPAMPNAASQTNRSVVETAVKNARREAAVPGVVTVRHANPMMPPVRSVALPPPFRSSRRRADPSTAATASSPNGSSRRRNSCRKIKDLLDCGLRIGCLAATRRGARGCGQAPPCVAGCQSTPRPGSILSDRTGTTDGASAPRGRRRTLMGLSTPPSAAGGRCYISRFRIAPPSLSWPPNRTKSCDSA